MSLSQDTGNQTLEKLQPKQAPRGMALRWKNMTKEERSAAFKKNWDVYRQRQAKVQEKVETDVSLCNSLVSLWEKEPLSWAHIFFPHHMRKPTPNFHLSIMKALLNDKFLAIASPRESAKSTLINFIYIFHGIFFKRFRFIIIGSSTFTKAAMYLETIKNELRENALLKSMMPFPIQIVKDAEGDAEFRHVDGFTTKILCKGRDQIGSVRGVKFGAYRPDLLIWDDVEDDKMVENPVLRLELERLYDEAWTPAGDKDKCQYVVIGTVLHDDSQIAKMTVQHEKYPEYATLFYQAHLNVDTKDEASLWPEKWTLEYLHTLRSEKPLVYAKEFQNNPVAGSMQRFKKEDFRYWKTEHNQYVLFDEEGHVSNTGDLRDCKAAIACDLAWEADREADFCVIFPGFLTPFSDLLLHTYVARKGIRPDEIEEILFSMSDRLQALTGSIVPIGFEKAKLEKVQKWLLKGEMRKRNKFLHVKDLLWDTDKRERIEIRLQPRYSQHVVYHLHGMGEYEHQLLRFPSATHDDLPDAAQGLVQLLQYPKQVKQVPKPDDMFMRLRQFTIDSRKRRTGLGLITHPRQHEAVPAQVAILS